MAITPKTTIQIEMPNEFAIDRIIDLLVGGFEGGVNYWARKARKVLPDGFDMEAWRHKNGFTDKWSSSTGGYQVSDFYLAPFVGGSIVFQEYDDGGRTVNVHHLTLDSIKQGLRIMATGGPDGKTWGVKSQHFADWLNENDDATTADVFIQCCVLGDIVYG